MKKSESLDEFLTAYKAFETAVSAAHNLGQLSYISNTCDSTDSVFSLESEIIDPDIKDKIRTCRIIRNYAQHHADAEEFLAVSAAMIEFLKERTKNILLLDGTAKDIMRRCPVNLTEKSTIAEFAAAFSKMHLTIYPYRCTDGSFDVASWVDIGIALGHGDPAKQKYSTAYKGKRQPVKAVYAFQNTPIASLPKDELILVLTQTKDKVLGVIIPSDLEGDEDTPASSQTL